MLVIYCYNAQNMIIIIMNNLRGDNNFQITMNRMTAADITQLRYLFDMYYCVLYNKNIIEDPESIFSFLSSVGKTEVRIQPKKLKLSTVNRKVLELTSRYKCNQDTSEGFPLVVLMHLYLDVISNNFLFTVLNFSFFGCILSSVFPTDNRNEKIDSGFSIIFLL